MIPVYVVPFKMKGYAFAMINESQEHDLQFVVGMDNGEIWTLNSTKVRFCKNITLGREELNLTDKSVFI